ncbi:MAG: hypothetical protein M0R51_14835 [Clostridia bacterium]|jgi:hypothetical protein|nr:hypothetical protein [Clostridia bacterium]
MKQQFANPLDWGFLISLGSIVTVAVTDVLSPGVEILTYLAAVIFCICYCKHTYIKVITENPVFLLDVEKDLKDAAAKLKRGDKNELNE